MWEPANAIWSAWASLRYKVAAWLFIRRRVWTADRLAKRGLTNKEKCVLCNLEKEDAHHLFNGLRMCYYHLGFSVGLGGFAICRSKHTSIIQAEAWWKEARDTLHEESKAKMDSIVMLTTWTVWRERNGRVFDNIFKLIQIVIEQIKGEARQWELASNGNLKINVS
jgi:hypothetical protein